MPAAKTTTKQTSAKRRAPTSASRSEFDDSPGVNALIASMKHPLTPTLEAIRQTILAADATITEGIKWNSPSFYCHGWFATIACRKAQLDVVLHCGAKVQADSAITDSVDDPDKLLTWPSKDRALVSFKRDADFRTRLQSFQRIISQWATYQKGKRRKEEGRSKK
jgi:hypothetical protein